MALYRLQLFRWRWSNAIDRLHSCCTGTELQHCQSCLVDAAAEVLKIILQTVSCAPELDASSSVLHVLLELVRHKGLYEAVSARLCEPELARAACIVEMTLADVLKVHVS